MNSVGNLALFLVIFVECVFAVPYGFGGVSRQEDAIVIDAAPSFTPVVSNPVHTPSCRHRIHYTPSSSSGSNTRQSYQPMHQSYHAYQPMREIVSNYNTYDSYGTVSRNPSHSLESPSYFQRQNDIQDEGYKHGPTGATYEAFMIHQDYPIPRTVMGYRLVSPSLDDVKSKETPQPSAEEPQEPKLLSAYN